MIRPTASIEKKHTQKKKRHTSTTTSSHPAQLIALRITTSKMHGEIKKAIASIHHERDGHGEDKAGRIHTPLFNAREMTEPLDLSHLRIEGVDPTHISFEDEIDSGAADEEDQEMDEEEEERFTRGRSRSRSVHENDDAGTFGGGFDSGTGNVAAPPVYIVPVHEEDPNKSKHQQENSGTTTNERTGPLAHREVVALQKVSFYSTSNIFLHV